MFKQGVIAELAVSLLLPYAVINFKSTKS